MLEPRENYLCWDDTFITMAQVIALRSKDPSTQCGAIIVDQNNHMVSAGYNGFPSNCHSNLLPWDREGKFLEKKYTYVCHAELNSILFGNTERIKGSRLFCSLFPCSECSKVIIQSQIVEVIYFSDKYHNTDECTAARKMFKMAGVKTRQFKCEREEIVIDLRN